MTATGSKTFEIAIAALTVIRAMLQYLQIIKSKLA
jgi:hypothetical protein